MEIETDKTSMPVPSPGSGIIEEIFVKDGDTVKPGMDLFKINITGEAPAPKAESPKAAAAPPPQPPPAAAPKPTGKIKSVKTTLHRSLLWLRYYL